MRIFSTVLLTLLATAELGLAQAPARPSCDTPDHHAFDFWQGKWTVKNLKGQAAGVSSVVMMHKGCVLAESWTSANGSTGSSQNIYFQGQWHQVWMDDVGGMLVMEGGIENGAMVMTTSDATIWGGGKPAFQRISWTQLPDGSVRQHGERSEDGGKSWVTNFDLSYTKTE